MTLWRSAQFRSPGRETKECVDDRARLQTVLNCADDDGLSANVKEEKAAIRVDH